MSDVFLRICLTVEILNKNSRISPHIRPKNTIPYQQIMDNVLIYFFKYKEETKDGSVDAEAEEA